MNEYKRVDQLSERTIRVLEPRATRYAVGDGRGLWLEVLPSGTKAWRFRYTINGRAEKVVIGPYPMIGLKEARIRRDELARKVWEGNSPAREKQLKKAALAPTTTLREFGDRYYREIVMRDRKDPGDIRRYLDNEIYPRLGDKALSEITPLVIQAIVFRKRDNGFPAAAAEIRNLLKRLLDYAVVCQAISSNPALAIPTRFITRTRSRTRALSAEEIRVYLGTIYSSNIRRQFKLALHIILLTLVRKSELLLARWENIHFDNGEWHIPSEHSKTGQPHVVYMSRQVMQLFEELRALAGDSLLVMPGRGSLRRPFAKNAMNKALDGLNFHMEAFTIHDLRRTGSTLLHEMGYVSDVIEKALNHTIGGVRGIYNRAQYANQRREMLQAWADYVEHLFTSPPR